MRVGVAVVGANVYDAMSLFTAGETQPGSFDIDVPSSLESLSLFLSEERFDETIYGKLITKTDELPGTMRSSLLTTRIP
jgi:hypothetical protein